jgi:hypothetical protein
LLERSLLPCFQEVASGGGGTPSDDNDDDDDNSEEMREMGLALALGALLDPQRARLAALLAALHVDSVFAVLTTAAAHPAGVRVLAQKQVAALLLEGTTSLSCNAPPRPLTFKRLHSAAAKASAVTGLPADMENEVNVEENEEEKSGQNSKNCFPKLTVLPPSLLDLLVSSMPAASSAAAADKRKCLRFLTTAVLSFAEVQAVAAVERWRRGMAVVRMVVEDSNANQALTSAKQKRVGGDGTGNATDVGALTTVAVVVGPCTGNGTDVGAGVGSGRGTGAGDAFDDSFLAATTSASLSASSSTTTTTTSCMDSIFAAITSTLTHFSSAAVTTANAAAAEITENDDADLGQLLTATACGGFVVDALVVAISLVRRKSSGNNGKGVKFRNGHVALGTLHELQLIGRSSSSDGGGGDGGSGGGGGGDGGVQLALVSTAATPAAGARGGGVLSRAAACVFEVSWLAGACGVVMEEALSGAPELLLFELVRSLHKSTTTAAAAAVAATNDSDATVAILGVGRSSTMCVAGGGGGGGGGDEAAHESLLKLAMKGGGDVDGGDGRKEGSVLMSAGGNPESGQVWAAVRRCTELMTTMGRSGVAHLLPAVGAMLLQIVATGFVGVFDDDEEEEEEEEEDGVNHDHRNGQQPHQSRSRRWEALGACIQLVVKLGESRSQVKTLAANPFTAVALAQGLLHFLPRVALAAPLQNVPTSSSSSSIPEANGLVGAAAEEEEDADGGGMVTWDCAVCTFHNTVPAAMKVMECEMCSTPHTPEPKAATPPVVVAAPALIGVGSTGGGGAATSSAFGCNARDQALAQQYVPLLESVLALVTGPFMLHRLFLEVALFLDLQQWKEEEEDDDDDDDDDEGDGNDNGAAHGSSSSGDSSLGVSSSSGVSGSSGRGVTLPGGGLPLCCLYDVLCEGVERVPEASQSASATSALLRLIASIASATTLTAATSNWAERGAGGRACC